MMDPILQARGELDHFTFDCSSTLVIIQSWLEKGASWLSQKRAGGSKVYKKFSFSTCSV